jgi:hypothetical protein
LPTLSAHPGNSIPLDSPPTSRLPTRRSADLIINDASAKIEPGVKVVGVFPDNSHDPIVYPVAATVNAKPGTIQYLAFLRSAAAKSIFEGYGFSVLAKPQPASELRLRALTSAFGGKADIRRT